MSTATLPPAARPLPPMPNNVARSRVWRDTPGGELREHDIEQPIDESTYLINGVVWACPEATCANGEWVIEPASAPKKPGCPAHIVPLIPMPIDGDAADPVAAGRQKMLARVNRHVAAKRDVAAAAIRRRLNRQVAEARGGLRHLYAEMVVPSTPRKGHLPSLAATAAVEVGVIYTVDLAGALESMAIGAAMAGWAAFIGYALAVWVQKQWAMRIRRQEWVGRKIQAAHRRGRYAAKAVAGTGVLFGVLGAIDGLYGLDLTSSWQAALVGALTLGVAWLVNRDHWDALWAERRRLRGIAEEKARAAAEAEARRLEEEARRLREEAELRDLLGDVSAYDEDNPEHQGQLMSIEWERVKRLPTAQAGFPKIGQTRIVPAATREIAVPDPDSGKLVRIGWEYLGVCEPGALVSNGGAPPLMAAKEWLVSVLFDGKFEPAAISLVDKPDNKQNTFLIMITERARLGEAVPFNPETAVRIEDGGDRRYAYLGRSLTGDDVWELMYCKGQPFGGGVTGQTGSGKGGYATRYLLACLLLRIFPVLVDPKGLVDYGDFVGLFPIGFTKRHRRMIMEFFHLERARRQAVAAAAPRTNRYGAVVPGDSKWSTHDPATGEIGVYGEPIVGVWDEFHDQITDQGFLLELTNHERLMRVAGMGGLLLTQGGGLEDWGNSMLRDIVMMTGRTNFRGGEMQARLSGNKNTTYSVADLPNLAGMCIRQAPGAPDVPVRAAYIGRDPDAEETIFTALWGKGATKVRQVEDPMDWIAEETKQLMKQTGVWDLWMLARKGGLDALLADDAEDEEDEETGRQVAMPTPKQMVPAKPKQSPGPMPIRDILAAILHLTPGLDIEGILASDCWARAGREAPASNVLTRAARELDPTVGGKYPLADGMKQLVDRGAGSKSWTLVGEGLQLGAEMAARLAPQAAYPAGVPYPGVYGTPAGGSPVSVIEMMEQRNAEIQAVIAAENARLQRL